MNPSIKFLIIYVGLLNAELNEILQTYNISISELLNNKKKTIKTLKKNEKEHFQFLSDLIDLFLKSLEELNRNSYKTEATSIAKELDKEIQFLLDLTKEDEYILLLSALFVAYKMPTDSITLRLLREKAERLFDEAVSIFSKNYSPTVIRNSYKVGQTIVDYLNTGKKIHYSVKKQLPSWAKRC